MTHKLKFLVFILLILTAKPLHANPPPVIADYNAEVRGSDGRVDIPVLIRRLTELRVNTYFFLIWHRETDWEDLKLFLPAAQNAGHRHLGLSRTTLGKPADIRHAILRTISSKLHTLGRRNRAIITRPSQLKSICNRRLLGQPQPIYPRLCIHHAPNGASHQPQHGILAPDVLSRNGPGICRKLQERNRWRSRRLSQNRANCTTGLAIAQRPERHTRKMAILLSRTHPPRQ